MAIDDADRFPPEPVISGAKTLVRNGLMQTDMDANFFRILNLDTSNLVLDEIPTQSAPSNNWFNSYDQGTHTFGFLRPNFSNIGGALTSSQQEQITRVGRVILGEWKATPLEPDRVPVLSAIRDPVANINMANHRITQLADAVDDQDAVNLRMFTVLGNLHVKAAVRLASTENMNLATLNRQVDGEDIFDNDRILVKDQNQPVQNGIYLAHPGSWTRATDSDTCVEMDGAACFVLEGDSHTGETWFQINPPPDPCVMGIEPAQWIWRLLSRSASSLDAGAGLGRSGNTIFAIGTANRISVGAGIDIDVNYEGQDSIGIVGTIFQGTWQGDILSPEFGGTGVNNNAFGITLIGDFATQLSPFAGPDAIPESFLICTLLGATNVTFPLVGTLATLNGNETLTNKHIAASQIDSGVLLISHGGTSANTATAALLNLLPDVTGHAGETLHTSGGVGFGPVFYWAP